MGRDGSSPAPRSQLLAIPPKPDQNNRQQGAPERQYSLFGEGGPASEATQFRPPEITTAAPRPSIDVEPDAVQRNTERCVVRTRSAEDRVSNRAPDTQQDRNERDRHNQKTCRPTESSSHACSQRASAMYRTLNGCVVDRIHSGTLTNWVRSMNVSSRLPEPAWSWWSCEGQSPPLSRRRSTSSGRRDD